MSEIFSLRQKDLLEFVSTAHESQQRKYINEPYAVHLSEVASMAHRHEIPYGYEIGICHDLIEDTFVTQPDLYKKLIEIGYTWDEANFITMRVHELTNEFTHEKYPYWNRKTRKAKELERLRAISPEAQSVKYCDIIDNISSIVEHDPKFAEIYVVEKSDVLTFCNKGNKTLHQKAIREVRKAKEKLKQHNSQKQPT